MFDRMHIPDLLILVKRSDIDIVQISISESIGFGYNMSDTQDGLRYWRNGIYILWLIFFPRDKDSDERFRALYW